MRFSYKIAIVFIFFSINTITSQEKLKGNGVVTIENRAISDFTKIEVIDDIKVLLVYNENQSVSIETDSNLQSAVLTKVKDGILTIRTDAVIGRNKELVAHINVNKKITDINIYNDVNMSSNNAIIIDSLTISAYDSSDINLKLNSKNISINGKSSSDITLELLSTNVTIHTEGTNQTTAVINTQNISLNTLGKSSITLSGTANDINITAFSGSTFKGKGFATKTATVNANNDAIVIINASEKLNIYSNNSTEINVYSNPEIIINEFFDKAIIRKKELN